MANPSPDKGSITDAEIAGFMGWRGPGAYKAGPLSRIRIIIDHVLAVERALASRPAEVDAVRLLREARAVLETWKDVAPAVSLCADIDKVLAGDGR